MKWWEILQSLGVTAIIAWAIPYFVCRHFNKKDKKTDDMEEIKKMLKRHDSLLEKNVQEISQMNTTLGFIKEGTVGLLRNKISDKANICLEKGWLSPKELDELNSLVKSYHDLGGNGFITTLMEHVQNLPIHN